MMQASKLTILKQGAQSRRAELRALEKLAQGVRTKHD